MVAEIVSVAFADTEKHAGMFEVNCAGINSHGVFRAIIFRPKDEEDAV
ncbi:hypothetical protein [Peribacillus sp. V2I11]|nr:hypothetical protein [Peribacillus sp. V2I11]MDQ0880831.1 hypothetical protein [Peribacillus sp. V2I11]